MENGLSVCLIVKNEANNIANCLNSIIKLRNQINLQIVVVDTGSDDSTKNIINSLNTSIVDKIDMVEEINLIEIFDYKWNDNFSDARNFAISKAKYNIILSIDADEIIENENKLIEIVKNPKRETSAWLINIESFAEKNNNTEYFSSYQFRLFLNDHKIKFNGIIHEQITDSLNKSNSNYEKTDIKIIHSGYNISDEKLFIKNQRNLNLLLKALEDNGSEDDYLLFQIGKTYLSLKDLSNAKLNLKKAIYNSKNNLTKQQALNYLINVNLELGLLNEAKEAAFESLKILSKQSFANFLLGEIFLKELDFRNAVIYYLGALENVNKNDISKLTGDYSVSENLLRFKIGFCYHELKDNNKAKEHFMAGLVKSPSDLNNILGLVKVFITSNHLSDALIWLKKAKNINPDNKDLDNYINQINVFLDNQNVQKVEEKSEFLQIIEDTKPNLEQNAVNNPENNEVNNEFNNEGSLKISLCMIVKNEENMLRGSLSSVQGLVDEIIIVDTGSTDKTLEIAKEFGAKIYYFDWINDFAVARNESIKYATGDWILYLDADERIKHKDFSLLREQIKNVDEIIGGIVCNIVSVHTSMYGEKETHKGGYPRIFRNLGYPKVKFIGRVHEQITPSLREFNLELAFSDIEIEHLGYDVSPEIMQTKVKRNYELLIQHVKDAPLDGYAWYQLGQTLAQMSLNQEAESSIRFAIANCKLSDSIYSSACSTLANLVGNKKDFSESLIWSEKALEKAPNQIYPLNLKGYSLLNLNRYKEALETFEKALEIKNNKQSIPNSGFDIDLDINIILNGIEKSKIGLNEQK